MDEAKNSKVRPMNYFERLNSINVNSKTEKKNGLTYLSWAWAWAEVKKMFPDATYTIYENADGWFYHTDGKTCWVKTGVTVNGIEHIEYLPVMDYRNASIPAEKVTSFDVNKAIQRSLTKACARHGLGLYVYAGEDLPEEESGPNEATLICADCGKVITDQNGTSADRIAKRALQSFGKMLCYDCAIKAKSAAKVAKETAQMDAEFKAVVG